MKLLVVGRGRLRVMGGKDDGGAAFCFGARLKGPRSAQCGLVRTYRLRRTPVKA